MTFEDLNLVPAIVSAVRDMGYETPTPIQTEAIPLILAGDDLLGGAQTGTGKTAAFSLPIIQRLLSGAAAAPGHIRALILCPTRELAAQVQDSVQQYSKNTTLTSAVIFGGVGMNAQIQTLQQGCDILVATPGRLLDLHQQDVVNFSSVEVLVLDEADRMLDMGFIHDVKKVLALLPANKQSLLFSATFSDDIRALAQGLLHNPKQVQVTPRNSTVQRITQTIYPVGRNRKKDLLLHIIQQHNWNQVLVFTRTKFGANHVAEYLNNNGITAMALHGNKSQTARTQALGGFKSGELRVLVATDIAARGIDIEDLPHVINYDIPNVPEDYVHRIGRTGRAGAEGHAISFVSLDEEGFMNAIEQFTRQLIPVQTIAGFGPEPGEIAEPIAMGRQTLWGGIGPAPGREVMAAAARAARQEMMQRMRENKTARQTPATGRSTPSRTRMPRPTAAQPHPATQPPQQHVVNVVLSDSAVMPPAPIASDASTYPAASFDSAQTIQPSQPGWEQPSSGDGMQQQRPQQRRYRRNRFRSGGNAQQRQQQSNGINAPQYGSYQGGTGHQTTDMASPPAHENSKRSKPPREQGRGQFQQQQPRRPQRERPEFQPRSHESATFKITGGEFGVPRKQGNGGQPDPLRTSVDSLRRGGNRGGGRNNGFGW